MIPASSGQGGTPMPVKNSQKKIEAYQPKVSGSTFGLLPLVRYK